MSDDEEYDDPTGTLADDFLADLDELDSGDEAEPEESGGGALSYPGTSLVASIDATRRCAMSLSRDQVLRLLGLVLGLMLFGFLVEMYIFYGRRRHRRRVAARLENSVAVARAPETEESHHGAIHEQGIASLLYKNCTLRSISISD